MGKAELLRYLKSCRLAVVSTMGRDGPQGAIVGVAVTDDFQIVFDTVDTTRKHAALLADPRAAVTFYGEGEKTAQYQGRAAAVSIDGDADAPFREAYYVAYPDGRERLAWKGLVYWRLEPVWARYSDYDAGPPIIEEFTWA